MDNNKNTLTDQEIIRAATNDPALSTRVVKLGDREFTVVDLDYDAYLKFLSLLQPLIETVAARVTSMRGISTAATEGLSVKDIIRYCGVQLPEMVRIVCSATDPNITIEEIKKIGKTPFKLAEVVVAQIEQNNIIRDVADFFGQSLRLLKAVMPQASETTDTTP